MRWRLFLEEYSPDIRWSKGTSNVVADALSRLELSATPMDESHFTEELRSFHYCYNKEERKNIKFPLSYQLIGQHQQTDKSIAKALGYGMYHIKSFHRDETQRELICYKEKIVIPKTLQLRVMDWYHETLVHPGINRTEETISQHLWWQNMRQDITKHGSTCSSCQRNKKRLQEVWSPSSYTG